MYVGDSLSLNMWQSMACILHSSLPQPANISYHRDAPTPNVTFLVRSSSHTLSSCSSFHPPPTHPPYLYFGVRSCCSPLPLMPLMRKTARLQRGLWSDIISVSLN
ncbi:unnamed protein product [Cuscuta epithymum]|uniref:Trichome birefringence-like C-terminal domain-containing protein n=1 Tax=Cuscuta epithymum TaxID=186058 RepID=A0AAV0E629_9ASTE|nr:unnamed protein product [Cuscuta epithymum]